MNIQNLNEYSIKYLFKYPKPFKWREYLNEDISALSRGSGPVSTVTQQHTENIYFVRVVAP